MRYIFLTLTSVFVFCTASCSRVQDSVHPGGIYDAGQIIADKSQKYSHVFTIKNITAAPVTLLKETHSCACTTVSLPQVTLKPGESARLPIDVNLPATHSKTSVTCSIETDYAPHRIWNYVINYESFPRIQFADQVIHVRDANSSSENTSDTKRPLSQHITYLDVYQRKSLNAPLPKLKVLSTPTLIASCAFEGPDVSQSTGPLQRYRYKCILTLRDEARSSASAAAEPLVVKLLNDDISPTSCMVAWGANSNLRISPSRLHFGVLKRGATSNPRKLIAFTANHTPFSIRNVTSDLKACPIIFDVKESTSEDAPGFSKIIEVQLSSPSESSGSTLSGTLKVETDVPGSLETFLPWSAFVE